MTDMAAKPFYILLGLASDQQHTKPADAGPGPNEKGKEIKNSR